MAPKLRETPLDETYLWGGSKSLFASSIDAVVGVALNAKHVPRLPYSNWDDPQSDFDGPITFDKPWGSQPPFRLPLDFLKQFWGNAPIEKHLPNRYGWVGQYADWTRHGVFGVSHASTTSLDGLKQVNHEWGNRIEHLSKLKPNWDGRGARSISIRAITECSQILIAAAEFS